MLAMCLLWSMCLQALISGDAEYQLVNLGTQADVVGGLEVCQLPDFSTQSTNRYILYNSTVSGIGNGAQFIFSSQDSQKAAHMPVLCASKPQK